METTIQGASYIGKPRSHTVMYIAKKVEHLLTHLEGVEGCLIFAEKGIDVPAELAAKHTFHMVDNPQGEYAKFVTQMAAEQEKRDRQRKLTLTEGGWYRGENVTIGEGAYIEPGVILGHDVKIGEHATILAGCVIRHAVIGDQFLANEYAVIGANGFTMANDEDGHKVRIPTLGHVVIGDHVEVGAHDNISRGSAGDTVLESHVKLDALVQIGHDVTVHEDAELAAGCIVGGFTKVGARIFAGVNSSMRNRIHVGDDVFVGMGSAVVRRVKPGRKIAGNPARGID